MIFIQSIHAVSGWRSRAHSICWLMFALGIYWSALPAVTYPTYAASLDETIPAQVVYGAPAIVGETLEPCETEVTTPGAVILTTIDDWQAGIDDAQPGATLLLRGGTYQATDQVQIPAGAAGQPITIKPYNCEPVMLYASLRPHSYNVIAGLHLETVGLLDQKWVIRVDGKNDGHIEHVVLRHNTILGGEIDAIRVLDDTRNVLILGNHIDGGGNGHNIFVTAERQALLPDQIEITNNRLTKLYFSTPAEDMFQVRDVRSVVFRHNTCSSGLNMEECVDIKSAKAPVQVSYNLFDGDTLQQIGTGEDGASGCMVIHEWDGEPENHLVEGNFFRNCKRTAIRFASGDAGTISRATMRGNLITHISNDDGVILIWQAQKVAWLHNTIINGHLKLGDSAQTKLPHDTVLKNNIFYGTRIDDNTRQPDSTYLCSHNLLYQTSGTGFTQSPCADLLEADPLFVNLSAADFHLQATTPGRAQGDNGLTLGAYAFDFVEFTSKVYLPVIVKKW